MDSPSFDDEGETEIPAHRRSGRGILDMEDEEETELGRGVRDDVTELEVAPSTGPLAMLWVKEGPRRGKFYPIRHGTVIGRKEGGLILDDPKVSSLHAKLTMEDGDFIIWDFGSSNGTYVNGKKIRKATVLEENDVVKIGETSFVVKLLDAKPKSKAARAGKTEGAGRSPKKAQG
jgi:pSer/pThr/pTyr-binding forkhead associated (FHA) protein